MRESIHTYTNTQLYAQWSTPIFKKVIKEWEGGNKKLERVWLKISINTFKYVLIETNKTIFLSKTKESVNYKKKYLYNYKTFKLQFTVLFKQIMIISTNYD